MDVGSEASRNDGVEVDEDEEEDDDEGEDDTASRRLLYMVGTALDVREGTRGEMMACASFHQLMRVFPSRHSSTTHLPTTFIHVESKIGDGIR